MTVTIHVGDCIEVLRTLPAESVHCVVTSPPYYGLRDYGAEGQIGLEESPDEYVAKLVEVFREVRRVLHPTGTVWLNLGDSYYGAGQRNQGNKDAQPKWSEKANREAGHRRGTPHPTHGLKFKDLMMIPARVAIALQDDGWWLRSDIVWSKGNPMPESVTDRPTKAHEYVFLLAKSERYFYDHEAIKEESVSDHPSGNGFVRPHRLSFRDKNGARGNTEQWQPSSAGRNKRSVWMVNTKPFPEAHFATFPPDLVEPMIKAGTSEHGVCPECGRQRGRVTAKEYEYANGNRKDALPYAAGSGHNNGTGKSTLHKVSTAVTVDWEPTCNCDTGDPVPAVCLDPFAGAGTALMVADRLGRDAIGIELNPDYAQMAARRIYQDAGMFADVEVLQ